MNKKSIILALSLVLIISSGCGFNPELGSGNKDKMKPTTVNYWRVFDGPDAFQEIINKYNAMHPNINIVYRKLRYEEYEKELLDAFAEDRGPDIFSIHNTWIKKYKSKLYPLPATINMAFPVVKGSIKKETIIEVRTNKSLTLKELKDNYADVVYSDVVIKDFNQTTQKNVENIYGLPLFIDTLALFYNKDLFNNAGIALPPAFWNKEFQQDVKKLTKQDVKGEIVQSGTALGGSTNIERFSDILSVLMMQNGTVMLDPSGKVMFDQVPETLKGQGINPGVEALRFYSDFANPAKEVYSWNKNLEKSTTLFNQGKLAMMFGYAYFLPTIKAEAPKINFGIAKLPQIEGNTQLINFANYWVESVSAKSKVKNEAWDFVQFAAKAEQVKSYLAIAKKPAALKSLISSQLDDIDMGVFADQVLTAKSWYKGEDPTAAEKIIGDMIDSAGDGKETIETVAGLGARRVEQTIRVK
jgi:multiple sugar transport system substrate-binding protein